MINIPNNLSDAFNKQTIQSLSQKKIQAPLSSYNIQTSNDAYPSIVSTPLHGTDASLVSTFTNKPMPVLEHPLQKGQKSSPDGSVLFSPVHTQDCESISVDFSKLNPAVMKIVFVLTINEALKNNLNFSMIDNAYIRIMDASDHELVSFRIDEYYPTVTSMMIGELYLYNDAWKFNAIGNGVVRDLAGLCELYGVQVL